MQPQVPEKKKNYSFRKHWSLRENVILRNLWNYFHKHISPFNESSKAINW